MKNILKRFGLQGNVALGTLLAHYVQITLPVDFLNGVVLTGSGHK